jgi:hypothetical protein
MASNGEEAVILTHSSGWSPSGCMASQSATVRLASALL